MENIELVLEVGTEEIPAGMLQTAANRLAQLIEESLAAQRLSFGERTVWYTPRRIVVGLSSIPARQADLVETVTGPPKSVAYDADGKPTRAAEAFAAKHGVALSRVSIVKTAKGEYLSVKRRIRGVKTRALLERLIPEAITRLEHPKAMYWTSDKFRFARPIRWILALYAGRTIRFRVADTESSNFTVGHRFLGKRRLPVTSLDSLKARLRENGVIVDPAERRERIEAGLTREADLAGGQLLEDRALLDLVVNLNEYPEVVRGSFDPRFLDLPKEILITVMREHQKYFSLLDRSGGLLPAFVAVINLETDRVDDIRKGHERVLRARLADGEFFWQTDRKKKLEERRESLRNVLFQEKLGSYYDKTERVRNLLPPLADAIGCRDLLPELETSARLFKCDLVTDMVKEFTDLQGIVGGLYAKEEGYPDTVWKAIYEQYLPRGGNSPSPSTRSGVALSLADRIDTVTGCFSVGLVPTGSRDPFAVRRQANGLLKILLDHRISLSLQKLIGWGLEPYRVSSAETSVELFRFFEGRLRSLFDEMGFAYDSINAVLSTGFDDPLDALERLRALERIRQEPDFLALASNFKRVKNILDQAGAVKGDPDPARMAEPAEKDLHAECARIQPRVDDARRRHDYELALREMASLRRSVDGFFEQVLVMAEDTGVRENRLALLGRLAGMFLSVADISQVVVERPPR